MLQTILLNAAAVIPPTWLVAPFALLLLLIATGPLFFAHFWHKYFKAIL